MQNGTITFDKGPTIEGIQFYNQSVVNKVINSDFSSRRDRVGTGELRFLSLDFLNESAWINNIIRTRGGFHIQINTKEIQEDYRKTWRGKLFSKKSDLYTIGMNDKNMIPLPGCNQFTYVPQLIKNK